MNKFIFRIDRFAQFPCPCNQFICGIMFESFKIFLYINDSIKISAIRNINYQFPKSGQSTVNFDAARKEGTLVSFTDFHFVCLPVCIQYSPILPVLPFLLYPGVFGLINPSSIAIVIVPMVPCPHIGRQPLVSINKTATSFCGSCGGYKNASAHHIMATGFKHQSLSYPVIFF